MTDSSPSTHDEPLLIEAQMLVLACFEGTATADQRLRLQQLVCESHLVRRWYVPYMHESLMLRHLAAFELKHLDGELIAAWPEKIGETSDGRTLAGVSSDEAAVEINKLDKNLSGLSPPVLGISPAPTFLPVTLHRTVEFFSQEVPFAILVATLFMIVGGLIGWYIPHERYTQLPWQPMASAERSSASVNVDDKANAAVKEDDMQWVGRITGMVDCKWVGARQAPAYHKIKLHDKFALVSGLVEITYKTGARVILQGPCTYEVESADGGFLSRGKLTARVEKKGERGEGRGESESTGKASGALATSHQPRVEKKGERGEGRGESKDVSENPPSALRLPPSSSPLFAVRTPTAIVTDLGTEFGVEVQPSGETQTYVLVGKIAVTGKGASDTQSQTLELIAGQSVQVNMQGDVLYLADEASASLAKNLVRKFPRPTPQKAIHLTDIVAGGDGLGARCWGGINAEDGSEAPSWHGRSIGAPANRYFPVPQNSLIDGVFIPNSVQGPVQIDSAGHTFDTFKANGNTQGPIWPGGAQFFNMTKDGRMMSQGAVLGGIDYGTPGHSLLDLAANKGITFDLDAIRAAHPDWRLGRFLAAAGNTEIATANTDINPLKYTADLWVFIDGQVRFSKTRVNRKDGAFSIDIPLKDSNRFLTLVAADGGNGITADWIVFGDPRLEVVEENPPAEKVTAETPTHAKGGQKAGGKENP